MTTTSGILQVDEDIFFGTLISLTRQKNFRSAWTYLQNNVPAEHTRVYDAGVLLEQLSNHYGDIGSLRDDCILKSELEHKVNQVISHLRE
jgi:hypothetical protein